MEEIRDKVKVDKSGRIVIPSKIREKMGIGRELKIIASYGVIILRKEFVDRKQIEKWYQELKKNELNVKKIGKKEKWMSEDYARRKLGM